MAAEIKYTEEHFLYLGGSLGAKLATDHGCFEQMEKDEDGRWIAPSRFASTLSYAKDDTTMKFRLRGVSDPDHCFRIVEQHALQRVDDIFNGRLENTVLVDGFPSGPRFSHDKR